MPEVKQGREILNTLLFKRIPLVILVELIYHVMLWLNAFLTKTGLSTTLLLHKIVYRHKLDFTKHCKGQFGTYCKAHSKPIPTNMMVT